MSLDGIAMRALADELHSRLLGAKVNKITQPDAHTMILHLRAAGENLCLLGSIHPEHTRLAVTDERYENPQTPPLFCMVLRKRLTYAEIVQVSQPHWERMIRITFAAHNEIGEPVTLHLQCELMGRQSNIMLLDDNNIILDAMRRVGPKTNTFRQIQPGLTYVPPPAQDKQSLDVITQESLAVHIIAHPSHLTMYKILLGYIAGLGPQTVRELLMRADIASDARNEYLGVIDYERLFDGIQALQRRIATRNWAPTIVLEAQQPVAFAPFPLLQFSGMTQRQVASMSTLLELYYATKAKHDRFEQKRNALSRVVIHERERCEKKLALQLETVQEAEDADIYRIYGELITANLYRIKQSAEACVPNFYDPEAVTVCIPMDASKTPNDNAQAYFKKYNKAKIGADKAAVQAEKTGIELDYLLSIEESLHTIETHSDLQEIRAELEKSGYVRKTVTRQQKQKKPELPKPLHFCHNGYDVYIGKNNAQNDHVTFKIGRNDDLWLHVKDIHGSHVIIKKHPDGFSDDIIQLAAMCAAWYSKGRQSSNVAVDHTLRKFVHKPSGAQPGKVIYTDQSTVYVTPDEVRIQQLLETPLER